MTEGRGVLNAPVELRCSLSNSSCSLGGRRGGAGPVANALRMLEVEKRRREEICRRDWSNLDIFELCEIYSSTSELEITGGQLLSSLIEMEAPSSEYMTTIS